MVEEIFDVNRTSSFDANYVSNYYIFDSGGSLSCLLDYIMIRGGNQSSESTDQTEPDPNCHMS